MDLEKALEEIGKNARLHQHKRPSLDMLMEEVQELSEALEGQHEHPPAFELIQIGGIVANWLAQINTNSDRSL